MFPDKRGFLQGIKPIEQIILNKLKYIKLEIGPNEILVEFLHILIFIS